MRPLEILSSLFILPLLAAGCGSSDDPPPGSKVLSFKVTDEGCEPHDARVPAGPVTFEAEGTSSSVTEFEVLEGETILGEKENLTEGLSGSFTLTMKPGRYTLRCKGGSEEDGALTVPASASTPN